MVQSGENSHDFYRKGMFPLSPFDNLIQIESLNRFIEACK